MPNDKLYASLPRRLASVWYRHFRVYTRNLISNGLPPFMEPLIFLGGIGLGLGNYIKTMDGMPYLTFLGMAMLISTAMYTAAFECSFATFVRLEFQKTYDGMLAAPISPADLLIGEILWAGSKGLFYSLAVLCVMSIFGILPMPGSLAAPVLGFFTAVMFAAISLWVTSWVKMINHFNFYFTGLISPMFFFSGVVFPLSDLPGFLRPVAELMPLTHPVRLARMLCQEKWEVVAIWDGFYMFAVTVIFGIWAIRRLTRRLIQ